MEDFLEMLRIADTIENKKDADFLRAAAGKLIPEPEPVFEKIEAIQGYGYLRQRAWGGG